MTHDELQNNSSDTGTKVPMNHDELLAKIHNALRAVVELHKPMFIETEGGEFALCSDCSRRVDLPGYGIQYPCKTIQAIEKELK